MEPQPYQRHRAASGTREPPRGCNGNLPGCYFRSVAAKPILAFQVGEGASRVTRRHGTMSNAGGDQRSLPSSLTLLSERFPHVRERAAWLYGQDESFRDLCQDYEECAGTVARFEAGGSTSAAIRKEYAALLMRLERELLRFLEEHPDRDES
jgi:hypothetical protein